MSKRNEGIHGVRDKSGLFVCFLFSVEVSFLLFCLNGMLQLEDMALGSRHVDFNKFLGHPTYPKTVDYMGLDLRREVFECLFLFLSFFLSWA